jgi:hypothetical protein
MSGRFSNPEISGKSGNPEMSQGTPEIGNSGFGFSSCSGVYTWNSRNFGVFSETNPGFPKLKCPDGFLTRRKFSRIPGNPQGFQGFVFHGCSDLYKNQSILGVFRGPISPISEIQNSEIGDICAFRISGISEIPMKKPCFHRNRSAQQYRFQIWDWGFQEISGTLLHN